VTVTDDDGDADSATTGPGLTVEYTISDGGFQPPLRDDVSNVAKYGSTIPVKVVVLGCDGSVVNGLELTIKLLKVSGSAPAEDINLPESTSAADTTGFMRDAGNHYEYNLATNSLPDRTAVYEIVVTITQTGQQVRTTFGLK
jgi:hypothetical protein